MRVYVWLCIFIIFTEIAYSTEDSPKHTIKCNMTHLYEDLPPAVDNISEMFSQGIFYGRLRFNSFGFKWKDEIDQIKENHATAGIGGSMIYKSGTINGFGVSAGAYMTQGYGSFNNEEAYLYKGGSEVMSRYDLLTDGKQYITSLAQAYVEYTHEDTFVRAGRQIFVSFLTQSNDTKMIPNTFEGLTLESASIPKTRFKMAYFTKQKLRDHSSFHHLLAVGDDANDPYSTFSENDDSAMHYGLTLSQLQARGIEDRLIVVQAQNESIEYLTLKMNYTAVPELLSSAMIQVDYRVYLGGWSVIPGMRVMQQFDNGAGAIGGANLKTLTQGYSDPDSLDATLYGARVDVVEDGFKLRFGYTSIADKGDIVAPWRGFPTGGFTRSMGQYNWHANTDTYMVQLDYDMDIDVDYDYDFFSDLKIISRFAIQDFDDEKIGVQADSKVFTVNFLKGFGGTSDMYLKTRIAHVVGDSDTIAGNGLTKIDPSYDEIRFEINYLF